MTLGAEQACAESYTNLAEHAQESEGNCEYGLRREGASRPLVVNGGAPTYYVGSLEEISSSGTLTKYIPSAAGLPTTVRVGTNTPSYLATDGLGSVEETLDSNGTATSQQLFTAFGTVRYSSGTPPTSYGFTGQRSDGASGLEYFNARYYDPTGRQFASADTVMDGLNRYGYVHGNPETEIDPSGYDGSDVSPWQQAIWWGIWFVNTVTGYDNPAPNQYVPISEATVANKISYYLNGPKQGPSEIGPTGGEPPWFVFTHQDAETDLTGQLGGTQDPTEVPGATTTPPPGSEAGEGSSSAQTGNSKRASSKKNQQQNALSAAQQRVAAVRAARLESVDAHFAPGRTRHQTRLWRERILNLGIFGGGAVRTSCTSPKSVRNRHLLPRIRASHQQRVGQYVGQPSSLTSSLHLWWPV